MKSLCIVWQHVWIYAQPTNELWQRYLSYWDYQKNKRYPLYTDRFYTSLFLADELNKIGLNVTCAILAKKKGLPKVLKIKQNKKGEAWKHLEVARKWLYHGQIREKSWWYQQSTLMAHVMFNPKGKYIFLATCLLMFIIIHLLDLMN